MNKIVSIVSVFYLILFLAFAVAYSGVSHDYTDEKYQETFSYLSSGFTDAEPPSFFDENESSHMKDVRTKFNWLNILFAAALMAVFKSAQENNRDFLRILRTSSLAVLIFILLISACGLLFSFNSLWTAFHYVFFPEGNWAFSQDSAIITMFPAEFFLEFITQMFLGAAASALSVFGITFIRK